MTNEQLANLTQLIQLGLQKLADDAQVTLAEAATLIPKSEEPVVEPEVKKSFEKSKDAA